MNEGFITMKQISRKKQTLALLAVAQIMVILDFSIVSIALPAIQQAFHLAPADLQWVVSAYAVMFGGFLLLFGRASDLFDRKQLFIVGLGVFSLASLVGGLAPSPLLVLMARAVQGLGAAIVSPAALALVLTTFEEGPERNRALGVFGSVAGIGFSVGVILGGVLTGFLNWRWVFFVNLPIGLLTMLLAIPVLAPSRSDGPRQHLDLAGVVLGTGTIVILVLALSRLATPGACLLQVLLLALLSLILGLSFVLVERRHPHALVPLHIFRVRNLSSANLIAGLASAIASVLAFVLTLYLQNVLGFTPLLTGFILATQVGVDPTLFAQYVWEGRTIEAHRAQIRAIMKVCEVRRADEEALLTWLCTNILSHEHYPERLRELIRAECRTRAIEVPGDLATLIETAFASYETQIYEVVMARLTPEIQSRLDVLLVSPPVNEGEEEEELPLNLLRLDPGPVGVESALRAR
jgi:MFS family permease